MIISNGSFNSISLTQGLAIYAAVVSTTVLIWDIVKWRFGSLPKILINVTPNMVLIDALGKQSVSKFVFRVTNIGTRTTTITNVTGRWYKTYFSYLRRNPNMHFVVANPLLTQPIPYKLEPGQEWVGGMNQDEFLNEHKVGYVQFGISHTLSASPIVQVLKIEDVIKSSKKN